MNPDKFFDYLDGKLSASERAQLEERVLSDDQLRRQLAIAREIHSSIRDSREVLASLKETSTSNRGAVLGRRIVIAFAVLVFANVLFGIYAIAFMEKKRRGKVSQDHNRQQLIQNLEKSAAAALPPPSFDVDEIKLIAPSPGQSWLADKVISEAQSCGGSGAKGLSDEHSTLLFAEIPSSRLNEFRERLSKMGAILPTPNSEVPTKPNTIVQVRIVDGLKP
jgi:hypothetical protein